MRLPTEIRNRIPQRIRRVIDDALVDIAPTIDRTPEEADRVRKVMVETLATITENYTERYYYYSNTVPVGALALRLYYSADVYDNDLSGEERVAAEEIRGLAQTLGLFVKRRGALDDYYDYFTKTLYGESNE